MKREFEIRPMGLAKLVLAATAGWYANDYFDDRSDVVLQEQYMKQYITEDGMHNEQRVYQHIPMEQIEQMRQQYQLPQASDRHE